MSITFFEWPSMDAWSVLVDNVAVGSVEVTGLDGGLYRFFPKPAMVQFTPYGQADIKKAAQQFAALQNITQRILK